MRWGHATVLLVVVRGLELELGTTTITVINVSIQNRHHLTNRNILVCDNHFIIMNNGAKDNTSRTSALYQLLSPDGYYSYLGLEKPAMKFATRFSLDHHHHDDDPNDDELNAMVELIHKNYRKLSLKHHPDRKGGDAETFRVLARARKVLTTPKLRREYDLLGLDLDDDEVGEEHQQHHDDPHENNNSTTSPIMKGNNDSSTSEPQESKKNTSAGGGGGTPNDTVLSAVASATLASLIQMMVRTAIMAIVSTVVSRYMILLCLTALLLLIILVRVHQNKGGKKEFAVLLSIFIGIFLMYYGRNHDYNWIFWFG